MAPNGKVYAIDLQLEMLNMLRGKLERPDAPPNIELVRGQASKTMLASKCADVVLIANVWHELDDHEAALQEAARILVPGGSGDLSHSWPLEIPLLLQLEVRNRASGAGKHPRISSLRAE